VSPLTGNGHEVGRQFMDDNLDLFVGGFAKDRGEDRMRHLCLSAFCRHSIGSHLLGGTRSTKGMHLVCTNDHTDDANEKGTGCSIPVLHICGNLGNGHADDYHDGAAASVASSKWISIWGCIEKDCGLVI
jgi:hypothetical protein